VRRRTGPSASTVDWPRPVRTDPDNPVDTRPAEDHPCWNKVR
jgi:hypothetical protein